MKTPPKITIVFFGDSITEYGEHSGGYIRLIQNALDAAGKLDNYELSGAGISGNTVFDLHRRIEADVLSVKPGLVIIYIGINDVWLKTAGNMTPIDKYEEYYSNIIKKLQENGIRVAICTPSVIGEKKSNANPQDADLEAYSAVVRKLAAVHNCTLIDLRKAFVNFEERYNLQDKEYGVLTTDGVHLGNRGNQLVAEEMMKTLFTP